MRNLVKLSFVLITILSFGLMVQSCKSTKNIQKTNIAGDPNITGTWILKSLNGQPVADAFKGRIPAMTLDASENRISGNGGCNNYTGAYTYAKGMLSAPNLASTKMMCMENNQENQFYAVLAKDNKISLANNTVLTLSNDGKVVAEFVRGVDNSLLSGEWVLESIADGDLKTLFADQIPTISFDIKENRLAGNAGCNRYNAVYKIDGTTITVGPIVSTRMACQNMEGESKFTQIITGASTLEATGKKVTFTKDGKTILTFVKAVK